MSTPPPRISRRALLTGLGATAVAAAGCGDASPGSGGGDGGGDSGGADACGSTSSLSAAELLAPIDTVVVLMMENRSFDHYLGTLSLLEDRPVDGLAGSETNPAPGGGGDVGVFRLEDFTPADPPHSWEECHAQWNGGANDGFVIEHEGDSQNDVMGYHDREQLPITYALADAGAVCDRWFCSVMGPTWPNRYYLHGATSHGITGNTPVVLEGGGFVSIFDLLDDAGLTGANYYHDLPWALGGYQKVTGLRSIARFFEDAAAGELPNLAVVDPQFFGEGANDDHPDHDVRLGQALIGSIYAALAASPQWERILFVVTYDEHGGFYDHVPPPEAVDERAEFRRYGFRVPSLVLGPHVRSGCAVGTVFDHVSIAKTLATRFGLADLNARMQTTADLSSCIDPAKLDAPAPPITLPTLDVALSKLRTRVSGRPSDAHAELARAVEGKALPPGVDRRSAGLGEVAHVLAWGERLGVLRVR